MVILGGATGGWVGGSSWGSGWEVVGVKERGREEELFFFFSLLFDCVTKIMNGFGLLWLNCQRSKVDFANQY